MHVLTEISTLSRLNHQEIIRLRGRVFAKKDCGKRLFLVVRDGLHTVQVVVAKPLAEGANLVSIAEYDVLRKIANESIVEIIGQVTATEKPVLSCSQQELELILIAYTIVSRAVLDLPIALKEAEREEKGEGAASISYCKRMDNRVLDLRTRLAQAIFRINDGLLYYVQKHLRKKGFIEIKTPKLIGGASEGGADVFTLDYFGQPACLAQSPQLYKQMAIIGDFKRVFEIGSVFRAENSDTTRHLTEFIGIDLEMVVDKSYKEVVRLLYQLLLDVFGKLSQKYSAEIALVHSIFPLPPLLLGEELVEIPFPEAVALLQTHGCPIAPGDDFSTEAEKKLGAIVREQYQTDLYVVTGYPSSVRPFYTMADPEDSAYSYAYDFMLRGTEIISGAQRIDDYSTLMQKAMASGTNPDAIYYYLEAFRYGVPPHAGAGMGLERILRAFLGLPDVRYVSLFPRDPKRLYP